MKSSLPVTLVAAFWTDYLHRLCLQAKNLEIHNHQPLSVKQDSLRGETESVYSPTVGVRVLTMTKKAKRILDSETGKLLLIGIL
jgi:hypothetical protein